MASAPLWLAFWRKLPQVGVINCDIFVFRFIFTLATFFFFCPDVAGDIGPFQLAIVLTALCLVPIFFWRENYGSSEEGESDGTESSPPQSMMASLRASAKLIWAQPVVLFLGLSQACFEGAVFTFGKHPACFIFLSCTIHEIIQNILYLIINKLLAIFHSVFMWVPSLLAVSSEVGGVLPTGLVFSSFMLSMTLGGMLFSLLLPVFPGGAEGLCVLVYLVAALAMAVPLFRFEFWFVVVAFLVLEAMVGMFNSCGATLRARYYPEGLQSSIMSVFRLPLNLVVVVGTRLTNNANSITALQFVFGVVVAMHLIAMLLQVALLVKVGSTPSIKQKQQ